MIINAGITQVIYQGRYADELAVSFLEQAGVRLVQFGDDEEG
jgi:deoxycytidylate deaminase